MKKKLGILLFFAGLFPYLLNAQTNSTKCIGVSVGYMFETHNVQTEIFFQLPIAKNWRVAPAIQSTFSHNNLKSWSIGGNVHYLVPFANRFAFYPLAGITFQSWRGYSHEEKLSNTTNRFGLTAGAGFEMSLSQCLNLHIEGKYTFIKIFHQPSIHIGLGYKF